MDLDVLEDFQSGGIMGGGKLVALSMKNVELSVERTKPSRGGRPSWQRRVILPFLEDAAFLEMKTGLVRRRGLEEVVGV